MIGKIISSAMIVAIIFAAALPATCQTPGRTTSLKTGDAQIIQLVGDSYDNTMGGIGNVYLYLLTKDPEQSSGFALHMSQADKNLMDLKKYLLLERPSNRDLHQAMETVISAKASLQTGAESLLATLNAPNTNDAPQKIAIFSTRVDHFSYAFEALERALYKCLVLTYGSANRDLASAVAVAHMQWDSVESVALAHKYLLSGDRMAAVQFDNKLTDLDSQTSRIRSNRDLTLPDQKAIAVALDSLVQKKTRYADKTHALFQAKEMNQGIDPSMLTLLRKDIDAFMAAVRNFIDLSFKKNVPADS